jgi:hypothetical protein
MIRKEQAAGHDLATAAEEARITFENLQGAPLDAIQDTNWKAARDQIAAALTQEIEFLGSYSLRKPRRPEWYSGPKETDTNWPRLESFLLTRKNWDPDTVASIDKTSTEVVSLLENPAQSDFSGRGLVVGYVQSGKTANMTATIAKAVDAGYRFVIVLAGLTNVLRKQTQGRLEADLIERNRFGWHLHTTDDDNGDFRTPPNRWFTVMEQTQIAVVKKNVTPLARLIRTIEKTSPALRERMPVLIIDDECDQASVNAGGQYDITRINEQIRKLLALLPKVQYIGYTATPFANVLINPEKQDGRLDDLYPQDFITALPLPKGYFGTESLFGRDPIDADEEKPDERGLDMIREVKPQEVGFLRPPSAKDRKTFIPSVTASLDEALRYYLLTVACRYVRGHRNQHCSMLLHTTSYVATHEHTAEAIREWLKEFKTRFVHDDGLDGELKELWERETERVPAEQFGHASLGYDEIRPHLIDVLHDLDVVVENGDSETRLDFRSGPKKYIVVGGSVLARGLTIEGLIVSFFVRSSSQYDTLLQMGRWFGYRPNYEDLPRIWMTNDLATAFRDLATVEAEIRADMNVYKQRDLTPADFAVRIRQIPGMSITAASKMIAAEDCDISFSGAHLQTIRFQHKDKDVLKDNWDAGSRLIDEALKSGKRDARPGRLLVRDVPLQVVLEFLNTYRASSKDSFGPELIKYVETEAERADQPFHFWNIGVVQPKDGKAAERPLGGFENVTLVKRSRLKSPVRADGAADIKALMSRRDVLTDVDTKVTATEWKTIMEERQKIVGDRTPLLLLYAVDRVSEADPDSKTRTALDAVADVLGVGLIIPDRGQRRSYVRVKLQPADAEEGEDLTVDAPPAEAAE